VVGWERFTKKLFKYYWGKGEIGQALYNPSLMLKMLLLSYLYDISERQVEILANDSLSIGFFLRSGADEIAPDHSTLTLLFKNRLISNSGMKAYEELFDQLLSIAHTRGVNFGRLQLVDSVRLVADVNAGKDRQRQNNGKSPRDKDAKWRSKEMA